MMKLLEAFPDVRWNCEELSKNPGITYKIIDRHPDWDWNWVELSQNPVTTEQDVLNHLEEHWSWEELSRNPSISLKFILRLKGVPLWFVENPSLTIKDIVETTWPHDPIPNITFQDIVENNLDAVKQDTVNTVDWDILEIARHPNITFKDMMYTLQIDWSFISSNPNITIDDIKNNPQIPWNFYELSRNKNLTLNFIMENWKEINSNHFFDWKGISRSPCIKWQDVIGNNHLSWDIKYLCENPSISPENIITLVGRKDWVELSRHPLLTFETVYNNQHLPWNWEVVYMNPAKTLDCLLYHPELPEYEKWISKRSIPFEIILNHKLSTDHDTLSFWNWQDISYYNKSIKWQDVVDRSYLPWDWDGLITQNFDDPQKEYDYVAVLNVKLKILHNMPKYVKMEMIEDKTLLSYYQIYHIIDS